MPDFDFTSPEGKKYTVSGPDGATQEQAWQVLQTQLAPAETKAPKMPTAGPHEAKSVWDDLVAGYQSSATGLALRGKLPDVELNPQHAKWYDRALAGVSGTVSDAPEMAAGFMAGGAAGTAIAPGIGTIVGAGAGTFAVPTAIREALIQAYQSGEAGSSGDFLSRAAIVMKETGKSALVGALTAGAGAVASRAIGSAIAPSIGTALSVPAAQRIIGGAGTAAEVGTMTVAPAALEGRLPEPKDFADAAILVGGMHLASGIAGKIANVYAKTGVRPEQVVADARTQPEVALDLKPVEGPSDSPEMMTVFHGSRHEFTQFDTTAIGTGEGSQAYGHGLYFAENEAVARTYKKAGVNEILFNGKLINPVDASHVAALKLVKSGDIKSKALLDIDREIEAQQNYRDSWANPNLEQNDSTVAALRGIDARAKFLQDVRSHIAEGTSADVSLPLPRSTGNLYKVEIPKSTPDKSLDWTASLDKQSPYVQAALKDFLKGKVTDVPDTALGPVKSYDLPVKGGGPILNATGASLYRHLSDKLNSLESANGDGAAKASEYLKALGIVGIKYRDAGSRVRVDGGTNNYVLFDAKDARVVERNGVKVGEPDTDIPRAYQTQAAAEVAKEAVLDPKYLTPEQRQQWLDNPFPKYPQDPSEPKVDLYPNVRTLTNDQDVHGAIALATQIAGDKILAATGGHMKLEEMYQKISSSLAEMTGTNATVPTGPVTQPMYVDMAIKKWLLDAAAKDLAAKRNAFDPVSSSMKDAVELMDAGNRLVAMSAQFQGMASDWGRTGVVIKSIQAGVRDADALKKLMEGTPDPVAFAAALKGADNPVALAAATRKALGPKALNNWQKAGQVFKFSLLSGFKTYQVKAIGDAVAIASNIVDRFTAAAVSAVDVFSKGEQSTVGEAKAYWTGLKTGTTAALRVGKETWAAGEVPDGTKNAWGGYTNTFGMQDGKPPPAGSWQDKINWTLNLPHRVMWTETQYARTLNEEGELGAQAYRQARREGYAEGTQEFAGRVQEISKSARDTPKEDLDPEWLTGIRAAVTKAGDEGTFTGKMGSIGQIFQQVAQNDLGQFVVPFATVPGNLVKWAVQRMPVVATMLGDVRDDIAAGGQRRDMALARQLMGGVVATAAYGAVKGGTLTGGGLYLDPEQRSVKVDSGWQPYSVKIGDKYFSYSRFDPIARIAALAADYSEIHDHLEEDDRANGLQMMGAVFGNALVSQTYLSGLHDFMQAIDKPFEQGGKWFDQFAGSWVPAMFSQIAAEHDPYKRRVDGLMDAVKNRLPGLRESLNPQINTLTGTPLQNTSDLTPINVSDISKDPVLSEAARLEVGVPRTPKSIELPAAHQREIGKIALSPEQQNIFAGTAGQVTHEALQSIVGTEQWQLMPDMAKRLVYRAAISEGRKVGRAQALTPEQRASEAQRISQELQAELAR